MIARRRASIDNYKTSIRRYDNYIGSVLPRRGVFGPTHIREAKLQTRKLSERIVHHNDKIKFLEIELHRLRRDLSPTRTGR